MEYDELKVAIVILNNAGYDIVFNKHTADVRICVKINNTMYEFDNIKELVDFAWAVC